MRWPAAATGFPHIRCNLAYIAYSATIFPDAVVSVHSAVVLATPCLLGY